MTCPPEPAPLRFPAPDEGPFAGERLPSLRAHLVKLGETGVP